MLRVAVSPPVVNLVRVMKESEVDYPMVDFRVSRSVRLLDLSWNLVELMDGWDLQKHRDDSSSV